VSASLVYAYGVVRAARRPAIGKDWPRLPKAGRPRALPAGPRLWLLVADVPAEDFEGAALQARIEDLEWLARCGVAHHEAIVRASRRLSIVPFRLFTVFRTEARALEEAARLKGRLERAIERVNGCREWVVRAAVDPDAPVQPARGPARTGTEYLLSRAATRRDVRRPSPGAAKLARELAASVSAHAKRTVRRPPTAEQGVLLDMALLVPRGREPDVSRTLRRWMPKLAERGCRVWQTGPWPPYSFVSVGRSGSRAGRRG
jgi:hypothetical protein